MGVEVVVGLLLVLHPRLHGRVALVAAAAELMHHIGRSFASCAEIGMPCLDCDAGSMLVVCWSHEHVLVVISVVIPS